MMWCASSNLIHPSIETPPMPSLLRRSRRSVAAPVGAGELDVARTLPHDNDIEPWSVAIAERTPPNDLQSLLAGYSTDICWLSASVQSTTQWW